MRIVPATLTHVLQIAPWLRMEDHRELVSATGKLPVDTLAASLGVSLRAYAGLDDQGHPILLGGVQRLSERVGVPWMVATPRILKCAREIARLTRPVVEALQDDFPILTNHADSRNKLHLRWLEWAGFTFTRTSTDHSVDGTPFIEFIRIRRPDV